MRRCINPYVIIDTIKRVVGHRPKRVFGNNRASVAVEMENGGIEEKMSGIKEVYGLPCEVTTHPKYNFNKGLIYVHEFDLENLEEFKADLQTKYNIVDVQPANFIKTKSSQSHAFITAFMQEYLSYSLHIPGERQNTRA